MPQPLSILHLHSSFDPGDMTARAVRLMNAFGDRARHTIVSAMPDQMGARAQIAPGVRHEIAQQPLPLLGRPSVARYEAIARYMRGFDLVLSYDWGAIDGAMARRVFGRGAPSLVHHEGGVDPDAAGAPRRQRALYRRLALGAAHAVVVPSAALERVALEAWKLPRAKVHRIGSGVATALYAGKPDPGAIPGFARKEREVVIGTVADLIADKDLPALVRAAGGVSARFRLVIVGEGPERAAIEQAALAMGIDDRVLLPGAIARPERFLGLFDLFALSSRTERDPIAVVEAMAAGLPIVSPPVGNVRELVAAENLPFITEHHGEVRLRDALQALAGDSALRRQIGLANQARARAGHDDGAMIAGHAALYAAAAGRPGCLD